MLKWLNRLIGIVLLLVLVAGVSTLFLPADRIAKIAAQQLRAQTGREVSLSGDIGLTFWPVLGVSAGELEVGSPDWSDKGPMLSARNAALGIDAAAFLRGEIKLTNIEAQSPTIRLETKSDGRASWQFTDASGAAVIETETAPTRDAQAFSVQRLAITDATLIYDAEGSDLISYSGVDLTLDWPDRTGPARIDAVLRPAGSNVTLAADIESFATFITGDVRPVTATLSTAGGSARLAGRAGTSGEAAGKLSIKTSNTGDFLAALGLGGADLPEGLGRSIDATADMTLTADRRLSLRDLVADLGGNRITGAADVSLNGVPQVNAQLNAGELDLRSATGGGATGGGSDAASGAGWPKESIDASGLAAFNGEIALRAGSIALGAVNFGPTRALLRNDRSRMVFELREVTAYDGTLSGEFVMNNRNGLSVGGKLFGQQLSVQGLLSDAMGLDRLTGAADAELQFLGAGQSVDAIMRSLKGSGAVNLGRGTIQGLDLDRLMKSGDVSGGTTVFDSLGATFSISDGVLRNDDLLAWLQNLEARGAGRIGVGAQDIDYLFTPKALRAQGGKGFAIPVRIRGPWSAPRILPDLEAAIDLNFAEERQQLEDKAKSELQRQLEDGLGVGVEEGQSAEDAIEKKLEHELGKKLRSIFD